MAREFALSCGVPAAGFISFSRALVTDVTLEMKRGSGDLQECQVDVMAMFSGGKDRVDGERGSQFFSIVGWCSALHKKCFAG